MTTAQYIGPSADEICHGLRSMGFQARKQGQSWKVSTAVCHPQSGGGKLNLQITDGRSTLLVTCFSEDCPPSHILDCLETLGFQVRAYSDGRHAPRRDAPLKPVMPRPLATRVPEPDPFPFTPEQELTTPKQVARALGGDASREPCQAPCPACGHQLRLWREGSGNGMRAACDGDCTYSHIMRATADQGWAIKRTYFYPLETGVVLKRTRWDHPQGKTYRGNGLVENPTLKFWQADQPENTILIVEGEQAAEALASAKLTGYTVATWPNGTSSAPRLNLDNCARRHLLLWPDDDPEGRKAMGAIAAIATEAGAASIRVIPNNGDTDLDAANYPPSSFEMVIKTAVSVNYLRNS